MITWTEIRSIVRSVLRWWWLCVLAVAVAAGSAFYMSQQETRFYVARIALRVGNTLDSRLPDPNQMSVGASLARYYGELARREPILGPVQSSLNLPFSWAILSDRMLMTNVVPSANLLEIYITDSNPERAAAIANKIGEQLIAFSPTSPEKIAAEQQAIEQQISESDLKIKDYQNKIAELKLQQESATSASDLAEISQKITLIEASLNQEQASYKGLLNYRSSSVVNSLSVFEPAVPPREPLPSKRKIIVGIAGLAGLMLSLAAIYVLELLDSRLRGPRENKARFDVDHLGTIPIGPPLLIATEPFAHERLGATRDAQTNILLAAAEQGARVLMITSPQPSEERTSFSIDLADLFGRSGHRVLLVDADFTASLLTQMLGQSSVAHMWASTSSEQNSHLWSYLRPTVLTNVALLPGKHQSGVPAMIPSLRWRELVEHLNGSADIIIFDGPAALSGPDAALLAPHMDGVVLTLDPSTNNNDDFARSRERLLHQKGTRLLGTVTFMPSKHHSRAGIRQRLRSWRTPELPDSHAQAVPLVTPIVDANQPEPIITPINTNQPTPYSAVRTPNNVSQQTPLITPPPSDAATETVTDQLPTQPAPGQATRKQRQPRQAGQSNKPSQRSRHRAKSS